MTHSLVSLKVSTMDHVARNFSGNDSRLLPQQCPIQLKNEIEEYRSKIGEAYLCSWEKGCTVCKEPKAEDDIN